MISSHLICWNGALMTEAMDLCPHKAQRSSCMTVALHERLFICPQYSTAPAQLACGCATPSTKCMLHLPPCLSTGARNYVRTSVGQQRKMETCYGWRRCSW